MPERKDGLGSLLIEDIEAIEAAKVKLAKRVETKAVAAAKVKAGRTFPERDLIEEDTEDEEEHEEVFTLGRMNTQSQTRVSRYFTAAEAQEATEPLDVIEGDDVDMEVDIEPEFDADDDDDFDQDRDGD
jgi:hypothetical protein